MRQGILRQRLLGIAALTLMLLSTIKGLAQVASDHLQGRYLAVASRDEHLYPTKPQKL